MTHALFVSLALTLLTHSSAFAEPASREDHRRAAFLGLAYGDASGALTETYTPREIFEVFGRHGSIRDPLPLRRIHDVRGRTNYRRLRIPGYVTDDTQQAMALMLSILNNSQIEAGRWAGLDDFARLLIAGSDRNAWRGQGGSFELAVKNLKRMRRLAEVERDPARHGIWTLFGLSRHLARPEVDANQIFDVRLSGARSDSIGAAMRTAPLGAILTIPEEILETIVIQSSLVTHADVRAVAMAYAMFKATRLLIEEKPIHVVRDQLIQHVRRVEGRLLDTPEWPKDQSNPHAISNAMEQIFARLDRAQNNEQVSLLVERYGRPSVYDLRKFKRRTASGGIAALSGLHALALSLTTLAEPREVIAYASNFGDDTDTVAAMAGSLLGARFGAEWMDVDALPDARRLRGYAAAIVTGAAPETTLDFLNAEVHLTANEREFQKALPSPPPNAACVAVLEGRATLRPAVDLFD